MVNEEDSQSSIWNRTVDTRPHLKKLRSRRLCPKGISTDLPATFHYSKLLHRAFVKQTQAKAKQVECENKMMVLRLSQVMGSRRSSSVKPEMRPHGPVSLNYCSRKREAERIQSQNRALAKRLEHKRPVVSTREIMQETDKFLGYKKHISRVNFLERVARSIVGH